MSEVDIWSTTGGTASRIIKGKHLWLIHWYEWEATYKNLSTRGWAWTFHKADYYAMETINRLKVVHKQLPSNQEN